MPTLLPKPPPMSAHNADLVLGKPGHDRVQRAVRVRCLRVAVDRQLSGHCVHVGDGAAGLQRGGMYARVKDVLRHDHLCGSEHGVRRRAVARLPVEDVVVGLASMSSRMTGASGSRARRASITGGSGSYSTSISSNASLAEYRSSATTKATSWPWKRTLSVASTATTS